MKPPEIRLIAAVGPNWEIGIKGTPEPGQLGLPWHCPEDLAQFKKHTLGHAIVMGKPTFKAIGRTLPSRMNIALSREPLPLIPLVKSNLQRLHWAKNWQEAILLAQPHGIMWVAGGAGVYRSALHQLPISQLLITFVANWQPTPDVQYHRFPIDLVDLGFWQSRQIATFEDGSYQVAYGRML